MPKRATRTTLNLIIAPLLMLLLLSLAACSRKDNAADDPFARIEAEMEREAAIMEFLDQIFGPMVRSLEEKIGVLAYFAPLAVLIVGAVVFHLIFFIHYETFLMRRYRLKLVGAPVVFTVICYLFVTGLPSLFGVGIDLVSASGSGMSGTERLLALLAVGAPGMLWLAIMSLVKTKNPFLVVINVAMMYVICFLAGYLFALFIGIRLVFGASKVLLQAATEGSRLVCPKCGATGVSAGMCPGCGVELS